MVKKNNQNPAASLENYENRDFSESWYLGSDRPEQECSWCGDSPVVYSEPGGFYLCESCAENAGRI